MTETPIFHNTVADIRARATDPQESHDAAASTDIAGSHRHVLNLLAFYGESTDEQLVQHANDDWARFEDTFYSPSRLRTARKELADQGLVRDTGARRLTRSKRYAAVWTVTSTGKSAA